MMRNANERGEAGILNVWTVLFVVFLVLKLVGTIGWSWWWVTAPLWGPLAVTLLFAALVGVVRAFTNRASVDTGSEIQRTMFNNQHLN